MTSLVSFLLHHPNLLAFLGLLDVVVVSVFVIKTFSVTALIQMLIGFVMSIIRAGFLGTIMLVALRPSLSLSPWQYYLLALAAVFLFEMQPLNFLDFEQQKLFRFKYEQLLCGLTRGRYDSYTLMGDRSATLKRRTQNHDPDADNGAIMTSSGGNTVYRSGDTSSQIKDNRPSSTEMHGTTPDDANPGKYRW